ncbi:MAG: membrane lipoprotein lipid attachment site-containing protein [Erysipelotrichaceae bacterium]|nr:membrane lipoprotein lipid attachment site-containing protein [Erysipelotrichaceae bacterium]
MKRLIVLLLAVFLLTGCTKQVEFTNDLRRKTIDSIDDALTVELPEFSENNSEKEFYSYYLFPGIGRREIDEISNIFVIYGNEAVLNLDVAGILTRSVYEESALRSIESFREKNFIKNGVCKNSRGLNMAYHIEMKVVDSIAYIIFQTNQFIFTASCPVLEADETAYEMIKTVRTCSVDTNKVIDKYSNIDKAQYDVSTIKLFKEVLPESGRIIDYMDDWQNDPGYTIIDREQRQGEIPSASDIRDSDIFKVPDEETDENNDTEQGEETSASTESNGD